MRDNSTNPALFNLFCSEKCLKNVTKNNLPLKCTCGEKYPIFDWRWSEKNNRTPVKFSHNNREILFHPTFSTGTAAVRGTKPFEKNMHYFWEIKVTSNLYGTDVMVGIGTATMNLSEWRLKFSSMLGSDYHSYGYSYLGAIQEKGIKRSYGPPFGVCSIIGVHLNMCDGTLEYYHNRKPLGIAFKGLKIKEKLYPMVSSTSAQSSLKLICAVAERPTLQMSCLRNITKSSILYKQYKEIPILKAIYDQKYFWVVPNFVD